MRNKIIILILLCFLGVYGFSQAPAPSGFASPYSTGYYRIGWLQSDSGSIPAYRDTNWIPKFQGTEFLWLHNGVDTAKWIRIGNKWIKELKQGDVIGGVSSFNTRTGAITLQSSDVTTALGFTPISNITGYVQAGSNVTLSGLGTQASPYVINSTASGTGTVTQFNFTNGNGLTGSVTNATTTPTLQLGTSLNGIVNANGTGFGTVSIGSGLNYSGGVLSATGGTSLNGLVSANGSAFTTASIGAGLSFSANTLTNTINNTNQLTNGAGFLTNITGLVNAGSNITITGSGTSGSPYVVNASGGGTGTVTTFSSGNLSPLFTTTVSNPNTTPALQFILSNAAANSVLGNNTGSSAVPVYYVPNATTVNGWLGYTSLSNTLTSAHIFVGNGSNVATDVAMSGDGSISNTGVLTITKRDSLFGVLDNVVGQNRTVDFAGIYNLTLTNIANGFIFGDTSSSSTGLGIVAVHKVDNSTLMASWTRSSSQQGGTRSSWNSGNPYGEVFSSPDGNTAHESYIRAYRDSLVENYYNSAAYYIHNLATAPDSSNWKPLVINTTTGEKRQLSFWPGGGGTITGAGNFSPLFNTGVSGSSITFTALNAAANTAFGNFTGSSAVPGFGKVPLAAQATNTANYIQGWDGSGNPTALPPDTLFVKNRVSGTGVQIGNISSDTLYLNNLVAGANITLTHNPDSSITIASSGGGGTTVVDTFQVVTSGSTVTVNNGVNTLIVDPSTPIASLTVTLPATPSARNYLEIVFGRAITRGNTIVSDFNIVANTGQTMTRNTSMGLVSSGDQGVRIKYYPTNANWYNEY